MCPADPRGRRVGHIHRLSLETGTTDASVSVSSPDGLTALVEGIQQGTATVAFTDEDRT
jgi:hypothetical protein